MAAGISSSVAVSFMFVYRMLRVMLLFVDSCVCLCLTGLAQSQMAQPFKMTHNAMQGSPAGPNYQQGTHSPSG